MNQFKTTLMSFVIAGLFAVSAQPTEIQWAKDCTSLVSPAIISVSYNTNSQHVTLYRAWSSNRQYTVEIYKASRLNPLFSETVFRSISSNTKFLVKFGTKNSFKIREGGSRIDYFCEYYRLNSN